MTIHLHLLDRILFSPFFKYFISDMFCDVGSLLPKEPLFRLFNLIKHVCVVGSFISQGSSIFSRWFDLSHVGDAIYLVYYKIDDTHLTK